MVNVAAGIQSLWPLGIYYFLCGVGSSYFFIQHSSSFQLHCQQVALS